jgi:hypothetical protein
MTLSPVIRSMRGVRREVLAKVSGVSRSTFARWGRASPTLAQLEAVVGAMGGRIVIEIPETMSECAECARATPTLAAGKRLICGICGMQKGEKT